MTIMDQNEKTGDKNRLDHRERERLEGESEGERTRVFIHTYKHTYRRQSNRQTGMYEYSHGYIRAVHILSSYISINAKPKTHTWTIRFDSRYARMNAQRPMKKI